MIKSARDIQWTTPGEVTSGQRTAIRNYFAELVQDEKDSLETLWVEPGRIVGYDIHERVVQGFLYDAGTGELLPPTLENYLMIPMRCELHFGSEEPLGILRSPEKIIFNKIL